MSTSSSVQPKSPSNRITASQAEALLKHDPTVSSGFQSPEKATVRVTKVVEGGVALKFHRADGAHGDLTVLGPPSVMEKGWFGALVDVLHELIKGIQTDGGGKGGADGGCGKFEVSGS